MAFSVSTINDYVNANVNELVGKAVLGAKTISVAAVQSGVKGSMYLNNLISAPFLQAGGCGWTPSGTTTVSRREIDSALIKVNETWCDKDLVNTYMEYDLKLAAGQKTLPFAQSFIDQNIKMIAKGNEMLIWQGDTTGSTYTLIDGFVKILGDEATVVDATTPSTGATSGYTLSAKPMEAIALMIAAIPAEIIDRDDLVIFVGQEIFKAYVAALQVANLFHYTATLDGSMELTIPGYNIKLIGVAGLNGVNKAYASFAENFVIGVDMQGDAEKFEFWYSVDNREYRFAVEYNLGVQVRFPDFVVSYLK